ncbi:MAG: hypothetical protein JWR16_789 [Nevskia sp.]|nr:hypothetical protein [Nevskia sp.]
MRPIFEEYGQLEGTRSVRGRMRIKFIFAGLYLLVFWIIGAFIRPDKLDAGLVGCLRAAFAVAGVLLIYAVVKTIIRTRAKRKGGNIRIVSNFHSSDHAHRFD